MTEDEIAKIIVDAAYYIHSNFGEALIKDGIMRMVNGLKE